MQGTYLQSFPKDLREEFIRFGGYWPTYLEQLPRELRKELAQYVKGVWFRAQLGKDEYEKATWLVLTNLVFADREAGRTGKRTIVIDRFEVPLGGLRWLHYRTGDTRIDLTNRGITVTHGDSKETYSKSIGDLFTLKLYKAALDLTGGSVDRDYHGFIGEIVARKEEEFPSLKRMYEDII